MTFRGNVATALEDAGVGEDIYLSSPKTQYGAFPPIELFGVQTDRRTLRAFLGWPLVIDIEPITMRCPSTGECTPSGGKCLAGVACRLPPLSLCNAPSPPPTTSASPSHLTRRATLTSPSAPILADNSLAAQQASICGEQTVCRDWPDVSTFPVQSYGFPAIGVTCSCAPLSSVYSSTLEELHLGPYSAQWPRTVMGAFFGSVSQARCRLDMLVRSVQYESSTASLTLQKGEERSLNFTLSVKGQGHVPGSAYGWRVLTPSYPYGVGGHHLDACHGVRYGPNEVNPNPDGACIFSPDGGVRVLDTSSAGEMISRPLSILTAASQLGGDALGMEQTVGIGMSLSAVQLRETRIDRPYRFTLHVEGDVDVPRTLTVDITLFVVTHIVSWLCTFETPTSLPPALPPLPPLAPAVLPAGACLCTNDCDRAYDGVCDDDGPGGKTAQLSGNLGGGSHASCALGDDCADCGTRRLPSGSPQVISPYPGVLASGLTLEQLREAQLECVPQHTRVVTGGMQSVDRIGVDEIEVFCSRQWVPDRFEPLAGRTADEVCVESNPMMSRVTAVPISESGCGEYRAGRCYVCCSLPEPPAPPSAPPGLPGICLNTCAFSGSRGCNDGGPGSEFATCDYGTDCEGELWRRIVPRTTAIYVCIPTARLPMNAEDRVDSRTHPLSQIVEFAPTRHRCSRLCCPPVGLVGSR